MTGIPATAAPVTAPVAAEGGALRRPRRRRRRLDRLRPIAITSEDPMPYDVTRVDRVLGGVPWGGQIVTAARSPFALGGLTVVASLLVLWAWWPRRPADDRT